MSEKEVGIEEYKSPEVRIARIKNQREWEENHEITFGMSFPNRSSQIRNQIYKGYSTLVGYRPDEIRHQRVTATWSSDFGDVQIEFVHRYFVKECTEKYQFFMDEIYDRIKKIGDDNEPVVMRYLAVMNGLGITIHPYFDGNGQTLRLLSLSYLHELVPKTKKLFFPYKSEKSDDLFSFNMGPLYIPDPSVGLNKIGEQMTELISDKVDFMLGDDGKGLLLEYILRVDSEEIGSMLSRSDERLNMMGTLRNLEKLATNIQRSLKNWICLDASYYEALERNNQIRIKKG